jgi:hypothetical protein
MLEIDVGEQLELKVKLDTEDNINTSTYSNNRVGAIFIRFYSKIHIKLLKIM